MRNATAIIAPAYADNTEASTYPAIEQERWLRVPRPMAARERFQMESFAAGSPREPCGSWLARLQSSSVPSAAHADGPKGNSAGRRPNILRQRASLPNRKTCQSSGKFRCSANACTRRNTLKNKPCQHLIDRPHGRQPGARRPPPSLVKQRMAVHANDSRKEPEVLMR